MDSCPRLLLPTDSPRGVENGGETAYFDFDWVFDRTQFGLGDSSPFAITLSAYAVLLYRYTGQQDFQVACSLREENPRNSDDPGQVRHCGVVRLQPQSTKSFRQLLGETRVVESALRIGGFSGSTTQDGENSPSNPGSPARSCEVAFVLSGTDSDCLAAGEDMVTHDLFAGIGVELALELVPNRSGFRGRIRYRRKLWCRDSIARLWGNFQTLVEEATANPDQLVSRLPILTSAERRQLLVDWNQSSAPYPTMRCVHHVFEAVVERVPNATAIVCGDSMLSYQDLNAQSNRLARYLVSRGVRSGDLVAVCLEKTPELIVSILAILKAGAAYLPLDADFPHRRLATMVQDARPIVLITSNRQSAKLVDLDVPFVWLHEDALRIAEGDTHNLEMNGSPESVAYVMYTSGSSGIPKGVEVLHRGITRLFCGTNYAEFAPSQRIAQLAPISFDASTFEIWGALLNGGCSVLIPPDVASDFAELEKSFTRHRVKTVWLTASLFNAIIDERPETLRGMSQILTGGESLSVRHVRRALEFLGTETRLINGYGPTENTTFTCCHSIPNAPSADAVSVPIGRPIVNTQVYLLDAQRQLVPIGVSGELYTGGAGVARGYLNRPELTAEKFVDNPFDESPGSKLYRTGDICRWRADGEIEFLGRADRQIKLRGFRIEPGEIESRMCEHPAVAQGIVVLRDDRPGDPRLVAYFVRSQGATRIDHAELTRYLRDRVPEFMVPSRFIELRKFELSANGKLDRSQLPPPGRSRPELSTDFVPPRNAVEAALVPVWEDLLGLDGIGIHDNFFELGGTSLTAMQLLSRAIGGFDTRVSVRTFFEGPTIADFAARIQLVRGGPESEETSEISIVDRTGSMKIPLSAGQRSLWFLDQLEKASCAYNLPRSVRIRGDLDNEALRRACEFLVHRHAALRTVFRPDKAGDPVQIILPPGRFEIPGEDLRNVVPTEREALAATRTEFESRKPFDLNGDLMLRAALLRTTDADSLLLLTVHHIAADGWSMNILWRELSAAYDAYSQGGTPSLPELRIQYADYAVWQRDQQDGERRIRLIGYWKQKLAGLETLAFPTDRPRPSTQSSHGAAVAFSIPGELAERLSALSRSVRATLNMTLLAAFQVLLARYSGQQDLAVGVPSAGRSREELESLIGFFVNMLVLRADLTGEPSFHQFLAQVRETALEAYDHQDLPFDSLVESLQPDRQPGCNPLFQTSFQLFDHLEVGPSLAGVDAQITSEPETGVRIDLEMHLWRQSDRIQGSLNYRPELFDASTIERFAGHYLTLLKGIVDDPDSSVWQLPLLTHPERRQLLFDWNHTTVEIPLEQGIHDLFAEQARQTPTAVAVEADDRVVSYQELNAQANLLARRISELGVVPGDIVGICMGRSPEMIAALLAILKSGGAYLPLDATLPMARLSILAADSRPRLILTDRSRFSSLSPLGIPLHVPERDWSVATNSVENSSAGTSRENQPERAAYVMYTSGSTGTPKGVVVPHRAVIRLVRGVDYARLDSSSRVVQLGPLSFDASTFEIWGPLLNGGCLLLPPDGPSDFGELERFFAKHRVQTVWLTAALFNAIVDERPQMLRGVSQILTGGEALSVPHVRRAFDRLDGETRLINGYGPTENTTFTCCHTISPTLDARTVSVPIGRPIANTRVYLLDSHCQPVPVGVVGELYTGGAGVALGYLNQSELTAERFIPNPIEGTPRETLYRTGDLCRWRVDGTIEFIGRVDQQIKLRGFRIEPGEIETALCGHVSVGQAFVMLREDHPGDRRLVAYCTPSDPRRAINSDELVTFLKETLPDFMIPSTIIGLSTLPRNINGKIDRGELPLPPDRASDPRTGDLPRNPVEATLVQIWKQLLGTQSLGIHDSFFELGGNSLLAMRLVGEIERHFQKRLPVALLFQHGTVFEIARVLGRPDQSRPASVVVVQPGDRNRRGLFLLPSMGGELLDFTRVIGHIDSSIPIWGIQPGLSPETTDRFDSFRTFASWFVAALREFQPHCPFALAGYSFGGMLAYEVASQLIELGETVDLLTIIDAGPAPRAVKRNRLDPLRQIGRIASNVPNWLRDDVFQTSPQRFIVRARRFVRALVRRLSRRVRNRADLLELEDIREVARISTQNLALRRKLFREFQLHRPAPAPVRIVLLRARTRPLLSGAPPDLNWEPFAREGVEIIELPSDHFQLMKEPTAALVAQELERRVRELAPGATSGPTNEGSEKIP